VPLALANQLAGNGATTMELIAAAMSSIVVAVSAVPALSNGWRTEVLISGLDHGVIVFVRRSLGCRQGSEPRSELARDARLRREAVQQVITNLDELR